MRSAFVIASCIVALVLANASGCSGDHVDVDAATEDTSVPAVKYGCNGTAELCHCVGGNDEYNRCTSPPVTEEWCCGEKPAFADLPAECICYSPTFFNDVIVPQNNLDPLRPCDDFATRSGRTRVPVCPPP